MIVIFVLFMISEDCFSNNGRCYIGVAFALIMTLYFLVAGMYGQALFFFLYTRRLREAAAFFNVDA